MSHKRPRINRRVRAQFNGDYWYCQVLKKGRWRILRDGRWEVWNMLG